ncbi:MAG: hypothetical protein FWD54_03335 [Endomicrobia bacterium]|nr:hypothetical protein [Endomicrobiia bacterium]MCL2799296.1 hypothetical protein [Endomicrobiia bacterium]
MGNKNMINAETDISASFKNQDGNIFTFFIDKNFTAFQGHFPENPLLPGIVHIEIALFCLKKLLNKNDAALKEVKKAKFIKPILPDTAICAVITENGEYFNITIKDDKETYSQISIAV